MKWSRYPQYKDSGIEWLGEIPENWYTIRSKWVFREVNNRSDKGEEELLTVSHITGVTPRSAKEVNMFMAETLEGYKKCQEGDLVINTMWAWMGALGVAFQDGIVSPSYNAYRFRNSNVVPKYFDLLFRTPNFIIEIIRYSKGIWSSRLRLYPEEFFKIIILTPPEEEQHAIAAFLDRETSRIDRLIEKKEKQIELLKEKRAALISHAVTKGLDPNVKMKDSGIDWLGEIPEHWRISSLKYNLRQKPSAIKTGPFGSQLLSSEMNSGDIKVYNQRNILDQNFNSGDNYISQQKYEDLRAFTIEPDDILVTTRGTIGHCALFPHNAEKGILHPCLMRIQVDSRKLLPEYLLILIQNSYIVELQLILMSNATTIDVIYSDSLKKIILSIPPIEEQIRILTFLDRESGKIDSLIKKVQKSIELLKEYRTGIISAAVTGKIDVRGTV